MDDLVDIKSNNGEIYIVFSVTGVDNIEKDITN